MTSRSHPILLFGVPGVPAGDRKASHHFLGSVNGMTVVTANVRDAEFNGFQYLNGWLDRASGAVGSTRYEGFQIAIPHSLNAGKHSLGAQAPDGLWMSFSYGYTIEHSPGNGGIKIRVAEAVSGELDFIRSGQGYSGTFHFVGTGKLEHDELAEIRVVEGSFMFDPTTLSKQPPGSPQKKKR
jgi:hypothetical protein